MQLHVVSPGLIEALLHELKKQIVTLCLFEAVLRVVGFVFIECFIIFAV